MHLHLRGSFILLVVILISIGCATNSNPAQPRTSNTLSPTASPQRPAADKKPADNSQRHTLLTLPLQCQKQVLTPALFKVVQRTLKTFEGSPIYNNVPPTIEWTPRRIQIAPARFPHETVPATYREVTEEISIIRRRVEVRGTAAEYKTIDKPVTTQEAYTFWKPGCIAAEASTCLAQAPAKKQILKQQFIRTPPRIRQVEVPEQTLTLTRKILVTPGQGYGTPIPAQYKEVNVGRISKVWQLLAQHQPDRLTTLPVRVKVRAESLHTRPALCYEQTGKAELSLIQQRLRQHGYAVKTNGVADQQTLRAIIKFQQAKQLSVGAITLETLRSLVAAP